MLGEFLDELLRKLDLLGRSWKLSRLDLFLNFEWRIASEYLMSRAGERLLGVKHHRKAQVSSLVLLVTCGGELMTLVPPEEKTATAALTRVVTARTRIFTHSMCRSPY